MNWQRIKEIITGRPHLYERARVVEEAAAELSNDVRKLSHTLKPYVEAEDPIATIMIDIFNERQMGMK